MWPAWAAESVKYLFGHQAQPIRAAQKGAREKNKGAEVKPQVFRKARRSDWGIADIGEDVW